MEKMNITSVYKYENPNGKKGFIYSMIQQENPATYTYYILELDNPIPTIRRLNQAIKVLQLEGINLIPISIETLEYETFLQYLGKINFAKKLTTKNTAYKNGSIKLSKKYPNNQN